MSKKGSISEKDEGATMMKNKSGKIGGRLDDVANSLLRSTLITKC